MSLIHLQSVDILNPIARFNDPYIFKITFECLSELQEDIEWKLIYVGSADDEKFDQELDNCMVGPVPVGVNSFEFEASAPSPSGIPSSDLLGLTVILLTASYRDNEFIRVGYYVRNEYETPELIENPPSEVDLSKVVRDVSVGKPRVTRLNISWDEPSGSAAVQSNQPLLQNEASGVPPPVQSMAAVAAAAASTASMTRTEPSRDAATSQEKEKVGAEEVKV